MKVLRLIAGITALAGIGVITTLIIRIIRERHESRYIYSQRWDEHDY